MTLLDRHIAFVEALRSAGLPVSLAEGLDAVAAIDALGLGDRETLRAAYAATLVKRQNHRPGFDQVFDLYFPALVGEGTTPSGSTARRPSVSCRGQRRSARTVRLGRSPGARRVPGGAGRRRWRWATRTRWRCWPREAVQRFGLIRGRGPGEQRWSSYNVMNRVSPDELVDKALARAARRRRPGDDPSLRRLVEAQARAFEALVDAEVRRRAAEVRGPEHVARHTVRPAIEQVDFTSARKADLELMRREIQPLARRLATRVSREQHAPARGPLDFRRTVRASMSSGGVPLETRHKPKRPGRTDLVVLCDVSGSVANFASFTLMLVFALREQFNRVRAFTFVDEIHEVTDRFTHRWRPRADDGRPRRERALRLAVGPHQLRPGVHPLPEQYADALTPRPTCSSSATPAPTTPTSRCPVVKELVHAARHSWWLNPEHRATGTPATPRPASTAATSRWSSAAT